MYHQEVLRIIKDHSPDKITSVEIMRELKIVTNEPVHEQRVRDVLRNLKKNNRNPNITREKKGKCFNYCFLSSTKPNNL